MPLPVRIVEAVDAHLGAAPWRVDEAALTDVDGHVIHRAAANAEEQQITRLDQQEIDSIVRNF